MGRTPAYNLTLSSDQPFIQIGSDDGLLPAPVTLSKLLLGTGERDVIIDFSNPALWGQTIIVYNNAKTPYPKGDPVDPRTTGSIMAFKVSKHLNRAYPVTTLPATLRRPIVALKSNQPPGNLFC